MSSGVGAGDVFPRVQAVPSLEVLLWRENWKVEEGILEQCEWARGQDHKGCSCPVLWSGSLGAYMCT